MTRSAWTGVAVLAIAVAASPAAASAASAAPAGGKVCPPLTGRTWHSLYKGRSGTRYQWSVIGSFTCASAKPWVAKLINDRARSADGANVVLHNGPGGYHCYATVPDKDGYAATGACFRGTWAYPGSGFSWNAG
ncbi:MAG TPA: hypothetical protein VLN26_15590 [Gaiellaceae bacterium]|nr:hypothetical protein [Gaiellaceae bacterium]